MAVSAVAKGRRRGDDPSPPPEKPSSRPSRTALTRPKAAPQLRRCPRPRAQRATAPPWGPRAAASACFDRGVSCTYFQSGSSGCFRSQSGRRLRTSGMTSKLYEAGGEVVAHSSVQASQGSSPAIRPFRSERRCSRRRSGSRPPGNATPVVIAGSRFPAAVGRVGVDAPRHPRAGRQVHRAEGQVEADQQQPEMPAAQPFAEHSARHLGEPVVEAGITANRVPPKRT